MVASEVKNLATQTAKATEDIAGADFQRIQGATNDAVEAIQGISRDDRRDQRHRHRDRRGGRGAGCGDARNRAQRSAGRQRHRRSRPTNIGGVTQAAGETGKAASQVLSATGELARQSETLRSEVDQFLRDIKTN